MALVAPAKSTEGAGEASGDERCPDLGYSGALLGEGTPSCR